MTVSASFALTVTLVKKDVTGYDSGGRRVYGTTETTVPGVMVWPSMSPNSDPEVVNQEDITTDRLASLWPESVILAVNDSVILPVLGEYQVEGIPFNWVSPLTGTAPGKQVLLKRVS